MLPVMRALARPPALLGAAVSALQGIRHVKQLATGSTSSSSSSGGGSGLVDALVLLNDICLSLQALFDCALYSYSPITSRNDAFLFKT
jgi:hypothetical protein